MKKQQNFYAHLDGLSICPENILAYCEEIKSMETDLVSYYREKDKNEKHLKAKMTILGVKTKKDLEIKIGEEIQKKKRIIENVSKFISFMKKENRKHIKIMKSQEFEDFLNNEDDLDEDFFEYIEFTPAYIQKKSGVLVLDLLETFGHIMKLLAVDIEEILGVKFPIKGTQPQLYLIQHSIKKNHISLTKQQSDELVHFVLTYEDFGFLIDVINNEIKELEKPLKL